MSDSKPRIVLEVSDPMLHEFAATIGSTGPVAVEGGRTRWEVGGSVGATARLVKAPGGIVSYRPEEMTVQVRAGTLVAELDAELAGAGQRCALGDRGGTVGGAVAVGEDHPDVLGRGLVRDAVLQVRYVSAEGELVTGGGPVVKNVSGFNLPKLMVGSLGTLGCLAEFVLRTNPIPAVSTWVASADADPIETFDALLRPAAVLWDGSTTYAHLEGHGPDVDAQIAALIEVGHFDLIGAGPLLPHTRWSVAPAEILDTVEQLRGPFVASIGVGRIWASSPQPVAPVDPVVQLLTNRMKHNFDPTGRLNPGRSN